MIRAVPCGPLQTQLYSAENTDVDNVQALRKRIRCGSLVRLVFYTKQGSVSIKARVARVEPLTVSFVGADAKLVNEDDRMLLIVLNKGGCFRAEAVVKKVSGKDGDWSVELSDELWEEMDRRRYPRHTVEIPVELRAIQESGGSCSVQVFKGETIDLSVGGAWVHLDEPVEPGTLVEVQISLTDKEHARVLGLVAHKTSHLVGFGIEFMDYIGSARYTLHNYLTEQAAA